MLKTLNIQKEKMKKHARENYKSHIKEKPIKITSNFSIENLKSKNSGVIYFRF